MCCVRMCCVHVCRYVWQKQWKHASDDKDFQAKLLKLHNGEYGCLPYAELNEGTRTLHARR
jgi:hypothetical protein